MAIRITEKYPLATIDTLTLSVQQQELARERIRFHSMNQRGGVLEQTSDKPLRSSMEARIRVHLMDYRAMPPAFEKSFDACISLEMLEVSVPSYVVVHEMLNAV